MNSEDHLPICPCPKCGSEETVIEDIYKDNGYDISEYFLYCICGEYLGHFYYGNWEY